MRSLLHIQLLRVVVAVERTSPVALVAVAVAVN
jgi:hypothetical protein